MNNAHFVLSIAIYSFQAIWLIKSERRNEFLRRYEKAIKKELDQPATLNSDRIIASYKNVFAGYKKSFWTI